MPASCAKAFLPDNGLVGLNHQPGQVGQQPARRVDLPRVDAGLEAEQVLAGVQRHHDFLERGVAGPFADPVDRALNLTRAVLNGDQRIGHRQPQVVVAVDGQYGLADVRHVRADIADASRRTPMGWRIRPCRGC